MFDEDRNILIKKTAELTEDNNRILHKMLRAQRWSTFFSFFKWVIIIGSAVGAYYYLQPFLDSAFNTYRQLLSGGETTPSTQTQEMRPAFDWQRIIRGI